MTQRRWSPGQPIPKRGEGLEPDAWGALCRHAEAATPKPAEQRPKRFKSPLPFVPPEVRAEYQRELAALASRYRAEGRPEAEAKRLALDDLGSVEFYDFMRGKKGAEVPHLNDAPAGRPGGAARLEQPAAERTYCSRCESIGHDVARCPFPAGDADVLRIAEARRRRRAGEKARAA